MTGHPLDLVAMTAYEAFRLGAGNAGCPPWSALTPEARADWRVVADAVLAMDGLKAADSGPFAAAVESELDDAFQFTNPDGSRHGYVTREWVERLLGIERSHLFVAIRHAIGLDKPWRGEALDLIYEVWQGKPESGEPS